jgi:Chaperone of endosialidase
VSKPSTYTNPWLIQFLCNNTNIGTVATNSTTNPTGVVYGTTSDLRLKENIRPTAKGLNDLMRIQVSDFNFKSKPGWTETGLIAQQLYTVLPEVVTRGGTDPSKDPWTVDYGRITPLLTKAIQEQQGEIDTLRQQAKNKRQLSKRRMQSLKQRMSSSRLRIQSSGKPIGHWPRSRLKWKH